MKRLLTVITVFFLSLSGALKAEEESPNLEQPQYQQYPQYPQYPQQPPPQGYQEYNYPPRDPYAIPNGPGESNVGDEASNNDETQAEESNTKESASKADLPENPVPEDESAPVGEFSKRKPSSLGKDKDDLGIDFENEDAFIDQQEAIRTEHYVRRAILSTIVNTTGKFGFKRFYINHLMGFNAVYQTENGPIKFTKYTSGMQGLSVGYVTKKGHAFELGMEASAVSNIYGGYRYIWRPEKYTVWPFAGIGIGTEVSSIKLSQGPAAAENYGRLGGMKQMGFGTLGLLIPIVEVGIKAEVRAVFYGLDRLVLTQGLGLIIFI
ncbi:MAG: hypothetical protein ACKOA8_13535 [Deltaproteobacteria bacterium]